MGHDVHESYKMSQAKILLVDDEPAIVETVRAYLEAGVYASRQHRWP